MQALSGDWMNYNEIYSNMLPCMAILAAFLLSGFASGQDNQDFLEGGYVGYSRTDDPGLAGMLRWLDQPVYSYPWYSSSGSSFYNQPYSETTFNPYREYYSTAGTTASTKPSGGIVSNPAKYDIRGRTPSVVYYGAGVGLPYSQYASLAPSKTCDLWIQGANNWTQYVVCPVGTWLQLVANAPAAGPAGFYEVVQTDTAATKYMIYQFNAGYNSMNYLADKVGRHMLYFVLKNQPSNVVVVDVFYQAPAVSGSKGVTTYAGTTQVPANPLGKGGSAGSFKTGRSSSLNSDGIATTTTTTTTPDGRTVTTTNGVTTITPPGQTVITSDGTYQTTTSPDGTQTTTSSPWGSTVTTTGDGLMASTSSGWI